MATKKLSELRSGNPASTLDGTEIVEVTQGGVSKGALVSQIGTYVGGVTLASAVLGPASAVDGHIPQFDGITGKLIKDGLALDIDGALTANSDTRIASQKAVKTAIAQAVADLLNSAPGALDTLDELAAALGDDANFASTVTTSLALKAPLASPALTGTPTAPTASGGTNTTQIATTAFVTAAVSAAGGGTVTSVAASVPSFLSISGTPITAAGTLAITFSGTALPIANGGTGATSASAARTSLGLGTVVTLDGDTDGTLAANSDSKVATQKAVKTYVDGAVTGLWEMKGATDCSGNPNYPSASKGDAYAVSVAGKIGGASGTSVDVGDIYVALADNAGGTEASVGSSWMHIEHNLVGVYVSGGTDVAVADGGTGASTASGARTNLGLGTVATLDSDTDTALAANSDLKVATQKAVKTYVDGIVTGGAVDAMIFKGVVDCSANPNYPAADAGNLYKVSVAGKIGGASGPNVEAGDTLYCIADGTASGNQATVGASWVIAQVNADGIVIGPASVTDGNLAAFDGATGKLIKQLTAAQVATFLGQNVRPRETIPIACSDETTALTAGTAKVTFRMPYAFTLTEVRASLTTAQTSGSIFTVDINESGTSVISTKLTIDNTEKTSTTAATPAVISDSSLADDAEMTVDVDQIGNGTAAGLKVYLIGYRT